MHLYLYILVSRGSLDLQLTSLSGYDLVCVYKVSILTNFPLMRVYTVLISRGECLAAQTELSCVNSLPGVGLQLAGVSA